jgi:hypothetical protein
MIRRYGMLRKNRVAVREHHRARANPSDFKVTRSVSENGAPAKFPLYIILLRARHSPASRQRCMRF